MWKKGIKDDNKLMKQEKQSGVSVINKYKSKKLKEKPTDELKYYEYLTYQRPILDELNYVSERMKTENINKQKTDFEFIEDLKNKREKQMKEMAKTESEIERLKKELFSGDEMVISDTTPTITTNLELVSRNDGDFEKIKEKASSKIQALVRGVNLREKALSSVIEALPETIGDVIKRTRGRPKGSKDTQPRKSRLPEILNAVPIYNPPSAPERTTEGFI